MSRWFRHYAGMMRDEKLVSAAVKSKQPVERVLWVWGAILESAAEVQDGGRYEFDCDEAAYFLRCEVSDISAVVAALEGLGRLADGGVVRWSERQYESDSSTERVRKHREKKSNADVQRGRNATDTVRNAGVTFQERCVTPPETETDTEPDSGVVLARARDLETELREAAGWQSHPNPNLFVTGPIASLIDAGADLELDVLPTIRALAPKCSSPNWKFFLGAIARARDERAAAAKIVTHPAILGETRGPYQNKPNRISGRQFLDIAEERLSQAVAGTGTRGYSDP